MPDQVNLFTPAVALQFVQCDLNRACSFCAAPVPAGLIMVTILTGAVCCINCARSRDAISAQAWDKMVAARAKIGGRR